MATSSQVPLRIRGFRGQAPTTPRNMPPCLIGSNFLASVSEQASRPEFLPPGAMSAPHPYFGHRVHSKRRSEHGKRRVAPVSTLPPQNPRKPLALYAGTSWHATAIPDAKPGAYSWGPEPVTAIARAATCPGRSEKPTTGFRALRRRDHGISRRRTAVRFDSARICRFRRHVIYCTTCCSVLRSR